MTELALVLTVREVSDWWGVPNTTAHRHVLKAYEDGDWRVRKSGATLLVMIQLPLNLYGVPKNERPNYDC
jgi:hypothetical protein